MAQNRGSRLAAAILAAIVLLVLVWVGFFRPDVRRAVAPGTLPSESPDLSSNRGRPMNGAPGAAGTGAPAGAPAAAPAPPPASAAPASPGASASAIALKGVVRNEATREPVEAARIRIYAHGSPSLVVEKTTGKDGMFEAEAPPAYRYAVSAEADGFRSWQDDSLVITRPSYGLEILLTPALTLRGRVVGPQDLGISDALVRLRRSGGGPPGFYTTNTDAKGNFSLSDIPREGQYQVDAHHPGFEPAAATNVAVPSESEITIRMLPGRGSGSLAGTVSDVSGKPVAAAVISLFDSRNRAISETRTDQQGRYRFAPLADGQYYAVRCSADGFLDTSDNQGAVAIYANMETRLDFRLDPGMQIKGNVVNQKGQPVLQALLVFATEDRQRSRSPQVTNTDDEGRFQISGLRDTVYRVTVSQRDYLELVTRLQPSGSPQTLVLDPGLTLQGTISDTRGSPVERFSLLFQSTTSRTVKSFNLTTTDGKFEIRGLARDEYQVRLVAPGAVFTGPLSMQNSAEVLAVLDFSDGARGERGGRGGRFENNLNLIRVK